MLKFDFRTNSAEVMKNLHNMRAGIVAKAVPAAANHTGRYIHGALTSEMKQVFDRPTPWALGGLRFRLATRHRPVVSIWLEEFGGKGIPAAVFLKAQIMGGARAHKRFEKALIAKGLMPATMFAVPSDAMPLNAYGNVPGPFIVRILSDLQAFGEQGYRANRRGARRGRKRSNYFFVPPKANKTLRQGVWWHMPNGLLAPVFIFVRSPQYAKRYDFYGVGERAYKRVAARFLGEEVERLLSA